MPFVSAFVCITRQQNKLDQPNLVQKLVFALASVWPVFRNKKIKDPGRNVKSVLACGDPTNRRTTDHWPQTYGSAFRTNCAVWVGQVGTAVPTVRDSIVRYA